MFMDNHEGIDPQEVHEEALIDDIKSIAENYLSTEKKGNKTFTIRDYYEDMHELKFYQHLIQLQEQAKSEPEQPDL